jgi:hypothetical protein
MLSDQLSKKEEIFLGKEKEYSQMKKGTKNSKTFQVFFTNFNKHF